MHNDQKSNHNTQTVAAKRIDKTKCLELLYDSSSNKTHFALWQGTEVRFVDRYSHLGVTYIPYAPNNNLITHNVVLLPSKPSEYRSFKNLVAEIQAYISKYVSLPTVFQKIAAYYVVLSWVYDDFSELPYLRVRGDYGTGKTRFLQVVGSICYRPMFASGASSVATLFHMLHEFHGTLILDEGDFRFSDEKAEIAKILNNGNAKGFPVLRCDTTPAKVFTPRAYEIYGPKIVAMRRNFTDPALESRFLTNTMTGEYIDTDMPINIPPQYREEALQIRNKLLLFRFKNAGLLSPDAATVPGGIEPRLAQIFRPLLALVGDDEARKEINVFLRQYQREVTLERGTGVEAEVLSVIRDLRSDTPDKPIPIKAVTDRFTEQYRSEYDRKITAKWIGGIVRKGLGLPTRKRQGVYVIPTSTTKLLARLYQKYGIEERQ